VTTRTITKVLIANRGEIAVRIARTLKEMGIAPVAVYSDADRLALHVRLAEEAYHIGPAPSLESYLDQDRIIEAARASGAEAVHPGYGFLAENAGFAERCRAEGLIFIGPTPESIALMGDKVAARRAMVNAGVSVVPGFQKAGAGDEELLEAAREIGFPVMIKASAGGGGKGMRLVETPADFSAALRAARGEAGSAFGDDTVYLEKYLVAPRHIEIQVLADEHGNVIHLGERECSVQRRHQKVVEEAPSPAVDAETRAEMGRMAVRAAQAAKYLNAGTVEFMLDAEGRFHFLEMNTRIQVEHPVTELITGLDLVREQIRVARGEALSLGQAEVAHRGHAIECRLYAEDPENDYIASPGNLWRLRWPDGNGTRVDSGVYQGADISMYYDPMVAKLLVWDTDRAGAIARMSRALDECIVRGVKNNLDLLRWVMRSEAFRRGEYDTSLLEGLEAASAGPGAGEQEPPVSAIIGAAYFLKDMAENGPRLQAEAAGAATESPWKQFGRRAALKRG